MTASSIDGIREKIRARMFTRTTDGHPDASPAANDNSVQDQTTNGNTDTLDNLYVFQSYLLFF